ncbi:class I SAM-dependent methyltransferase [Pseudomonas sp. WS 5071]|uniref:class I SAM-dependent methyltransferase n=1 Tax=Pseudomonas sp. WS 5071 TaxID=2717479 RepID=UPI001475ECC2|nr:class I SAM-dependent methyltransferase [Pseudomonas sp. WS 5071]NMY76252.1 class I SAM-dependent methyltransferase [Pseudomonas sp. WS 5071]
MDPRSEVLLRQPDYFQGNVLLVGLPPDDALGRLPNAHGWCWHAGDHAALEARFAGRVHFGVDVPERAFDTAVVYLPKSKELSDYVLKTVAARLPNADVFLVGEKKGGIEGASKQLIPFGKPRKLDSARHCQLWQVSVVNVPQAPVLAHLAQHYELALEEGPLNVVSLPGVFSHGRLDRGSALLLDNLDKLPSGHVLDFGCGAGVLGAAVKRRYPHNSVTLLDVDAFATASSRLTLAANGLEGEVICGDGIDAAPMELNTILSNPPFHVGVHTDYQATENLLQKAIKHLKKGGELRIVANSFLRYQPLIEEQFGACTVKAEGQGFRIYSVKRR